MSAPALLLALACALPAAAKPPKQAADKCDLPRRLIGTWSGKMNCRGGRHGGVLVIKTGAPGACIIATLQGGILGPITVTETPASGTYRMTAPPAAAVLTIFDNGRRLTFSPDPASGGGAQLITFSGAATLDAARTNAAVRYAYKTPIAPKDNCLGTMTRTATQRYEHVDSDGAR